MTVTRDCLLGGACLLILLVLSEQVMLRDTGTEGRTGRADATDREVQEEIEPDNGEKESWGSWGEHQTCPDGTFVSGFQLKVEVIDFLTDNTALNGVALLCYPPREDKINWITDLAANITSAVGEWGTWGGVSRCPRGDFLVGFRMRIEKITKTNLDNTAANNLDGECEGGMKIRGDGTDRGEFGNWSRCPDDTAICGLTTKVQPPQGPFADDAALITLTLDCCEL